MRSRNRNAGFSLIEYVVAFAVLSVAVLAVWGFYFVATQNFSRVNKQSALHNEAQLTVNQLERIVVNADLGVEYDESSKTLTLYDIAYNDAGNQIGIKVEGIKWENECLYYGETLLQNAAPNSTLPTVSADSEWQLMAEGVTNFSIEVDEENDRLITDLAFEKGSFDYDTKENYISFRNDVVCADENTTVGDLEEAIGKLGPNAVTGVCVNISPAVAAVGSSARLNWTVTGGTAVSQTIDKWVISKDRGMQNLLSAEEYSITDGNVSFAFASEVPKVLYFQAMVKDANETEDVYVTSNIVQLRFVQEMTISSENVSNSANSETVASGEDLQLYVKVVGDELAPMEKMVTWSIENESAGVLATVDQNGLVQVSPSSGSGTFYVAATLNEYPSIKQYYGVVVESDYHASGTLKLTPPMIHDYGTDALKPQEKINRGGEMQYKVSFNDAEINPMYCDWEAIVYCHDTDETFASDAVRVGATGILSIKEGLNFGYRYTVTVTATLKNNSAITAQAKVDIPIVSIHFVPGIENIPRTGTQKAAACKIDGLEDYDIKWTFKDTGESFILTDTVQMQLAGRKEGEYHVAYIGIGSHYSKQSDLTIKASLVDYPNMGAEYTIKFVN